MNFYCAEIERLNGMTVEFTHRDEEKLISKTPLIIYHRIELS